MSTLLRPCVFSTDFFSYRDNTFYADASDLSNGELFSRVWSDSYDVGLTLVNPSTGNEEVFYIDDTDKDEEGDITGWRLKPVNKALADRGITITLFND